MATSSVTPQNVIDTTTTTMSASTTEENNNNTPRRREEDELSNVSSNAATAGSASTPRSPNTATSAGAANGSSSFPLRERIVRIKRRRHETPVEEILIEEKSADKKKRTASVASISEDLSKSSLQHAPRTGPKKFRLLTSDVAIDKATEKSYTQILQERLRDIRENKHRPSIKQQESINTVSQALAHRHEKRFHEEAHRARFVQIKQRREEGKAQREEEEDYMRSVFSVVDIVRESVETEVEEQVVPTRAATSAVNPTLIPHQIPPPPPSQTILVNGRPMKRVFTPIDAKAYGQMLAEKAKQQQQRTTRPLDEDDIVPQHVIPSTVPGGPPVAPIPTHDETHKPTQPTDKSVFDYTTEKPESDYVYDIYYFEDEDLPMTEEQQIESQIQHLEKHAPVIVTIESFDEDLVYENEYDEHDNDHDNPDSEDSNASDNPDYDYPDEDDISDEEHAFDLGEGASDDFMTESDEEGDNRMYRQWSHMDAWGGGNIRDRDLEYDQVLSDHQSDDDDDLGYDYY